MPEMRMFRSYCLIYPLVGTIIFAGSCEQIEKSSRNPELVEAKIQGNNIRSALNYYWLDNRSFPENLGELNIGWNEDSSSLRGSSLVWVYSRLEDGKKCQLLTKMMVDGYFVFLDQNGEITAARVMPRSLEEITWSGL